MKKNLEKSLEKTSTKASIKTSRKMMVLTQKLEGISKKIFERYKKIIIQHIGSKPGVYALYDEKELYYVGRASDLARRVNYHLKDQHSALWTHFSVYVTKKEKYANDIEALVIAIADPRGNKSKPKLGTGTKLKDSIKKVIELSYQEELRELGFANKKRSSVKSPSKKRPNLKNYFNEDKPLRKTYKGKSYKALLLTSGRIEYENKLYNTPTSAAVAVVQSKTVNGWNFWFIQNNENNWVKLSELS